VQEAKTNKTPQTAGVHGRLFGPAWGWNQFIVRSIGKTQKVLFKKKLAAPDEPASK
jgi:hypothetical protein